MTEGDQNRYSKEDSFGRERLAPRDLGLPDNANTSLNRSRAPTEQIGSVAAVNRGEGWDIEKLQSSAQSFRIGVLIFCRRLKPITRKSFVVSITVI
jgi:hypothetical protein